MGRDGVGLGMVLGCGSVKNGEWLRDGLGKELGWGGRWMADALWGDT